MSKSSTALSIPTGTEVARGNGNVHSAASHAMMMMTVFSAVRLSVFFVNSMHD